MSDLARSLREYADSAPSIHPAEVIEAAMPPGRATPSDTGRRGVRAAVLAGVAASVVGLMLIAAIGGAGDDGAAGPGSHITVTLVAAVPGPTPAAPPWPGLRLFAPSVVPDGMELFGSHVPTAASGTTGDVEPGHGGSAHLLYVDPDDEGRTLMIMLWPEGFAPTDGAGDTVDLRGTTGSLVGRESDGVRLSWIEGGVALQLVGGGISADAVIEVAEGLVTDAWPT